MNAAPRHYCRNPRCRSKLPVPVDNDHHAFCARGCHESFYRSRCLVCEDPMQRKREGQRIRSGHAKCRAEYRKFPHAFAFPLPRPQISDECCSRSAHSTGLKSDVRGDRPTARCLREWWWGGDGDRDHSLYDKDGVTIARVVLEGDGRYHLRTPVTIPRRTWAFLGEAKRGAESFALMAIPLAAVEPKLAARIRRDNETPHPMGPPLNRPRPANTGDAVLLGANHRITEARTDSGIDTSIPHFLRRVSP
jgi:hypothetical protein